MVNKYLDFSWGKAILIIILDFILIVLYNFVRPACGYSQDMQTIPLCISNTQYVIIILGVIITSYLGFIMVRFLFKKFKT